jgi:hypothetical protein
MNFYKMGSEDALIKLGFGKALSRAWGELAPRSQQMLKQYGREPLVVPWQLPKGPAAQARCWARLAALQAVGC